MWKVLQHWNPYVGRVAPHINMSAYTRATCNSLSMIPIHMPWLQAYLRKAPPIIRPLNALLEMCDKQAKKRIASGTGTADLFYYLVSRILPLPRFLSCACSETLCSCVGCRTMKTRPTIRRRCSPISSTTARSR